MGVIAERLVKLLPALVAGGLALVYILGAIVAGSEFDGAGVDPRDAVPLLSLEQLLARGVGVLVRPAALLSFLFLASGAAMLAIGVLRLQQREGEGRPLEGPLDKVPPRKMGLLGIALLVAAPLITPLNQIPGMAVLLGGAGVTALVYETSSPAWKARKPLFLAVMTIFALFGLGVSAYTDPTPSSEVEVVQQGDRRGVRGTLITHSNGTWYVFLPRVEEIRAYPDGAIESATVFKRPPSDSNDSDAPIDYIWRGIAWASPIF